MPTKKTPDELHLKLVVLTEQVSMYINAAKLIDNDHETRLRKIEDLIAKLDGKLDKELGVVKERLTVLNILQTAFTSVVGIIASFLRIGK